MLVAAFAPMNQPYPSTNIAWLIHLTERVFDGATLDVDVSENRPSAMFLLAAAPVAFGRLIDIDPTHAYHVWVSDFIAFSLILCFRISRDILFENRPATRHTFLISAVGVLNVVPLPAGATVPLAQPPQPHAHANQQNKVSTCKLASFPSPHVESDFETQGTPKSAQTNIIPL